LSAVRELTAALISAGMDPADAATLIVRAGAELTISAASKGAVRTRNWRARNASQTVTGDDDERKSNNVTNRHNASHVTLGDNASISKDYKKESKRQNRGTRIGHDWAPSDAERSFARQEGFSDFEVNREIQKFRDYWTACAGAKGVKLDWSATWRQWIRSGAERAGKAPTSGPAVANLTSFYAAADSEQLAAWDTYSLRTTGKGMPRDRNQGWRVKSEWPPDYAPAAQPAREAAE